jgi:hypothetical protein
MSLLSDSEPERNQQKKKFKGQFQRQLKQQDKPCDNKVKNPTTKMLLRSIR